MRCDGLTELFGKAQCGKLCTYITRTCLWSYAKTKTRTALKLFSFLVLHIAYTFTLTNCRRIPPPPLAEFVPRQPEKWLRRGWGFWVTLLFSVHYYFMTPFRITSHNSRLSIGKWRNLVNIRCTYYHSKLMVNRSLKQSEIYRRSGHSWSRKKINRLLFFVPTGLLYLSQTHINVVIRQLKL